jgi:hypothetical protein
MSSNKITQKTKSNKIARVLSHEEALDLIAETVETGDLHAAAAKRGLNLAETFHQLSSYENAISFKNLMTYSFVFRSAPMAKRLLEDSIANKIPLDKSLLSAAKTILDRAGFTTHKAIEPVRKPSDKVRLTVEELTAIVQAAQGAKRAESPIDLQAEEAQVIDVFS